MKTAFLRAFLLCASLLTSTFLLQHAPPPARAQGEPYTRVPVITKTQPITPGVYPLYDYRNLDKSYHIVGGHQSFDWRVLEPTEGNYNWTRLDSWIDQEWDKGKPVAIGIEIYAPNNTIPHRVPDFILSAIPPVSCGPDGSRKVPRFWDPLFLEKYRNFILAFGARYRDDPRVTWIQMGAGIWQETHPEVDAYIPCVRDAMAADVGTESNEELSLVWINTVNTIQQAYKDAFGDKPLMLMYASYFLNYWERDGWAARGYEGFVPYAVRNGIGFKHNGLLPDHWVGTSYNAIKNNWGAVHGAFEPAGGYANDQEIYWAILAALDAHADYVAFHPNHFLNDCGNQTNGCGYDMSVAFAAYDFFNAYAGTRPANTPGAWVALRDSWYYFGSHDNYSWLLYQDFAAPGGATKPVSHLAGRARGDQRGNDNMRQDTTIGTFKESRWTRRTDQASNNPYMYFNIDDAYIYSGTHWLEFQIVYFDKGTDQWQMIYDGPDDTTPIGHLRTKTNTNTWITATFVISDGEFINSISNNDFRLESMGDGDEYFHFIKISPTTPRICPWGDRDGSGEVGASDVQFLASLWRQPRHDHDYDGDGLITLIDILAPALTWGQPCHYEQPPAPTNKPIP